MIRRRTLGWLLKLLATVGIFLPPQPVISAARLSGEIILTLRNAVTGEIEECHHFHNLITNGGRTKLANLLIGATTDSVNYLELGTGTTTPAAADTVLTTPNAASWKSIGTRLLYNTYYAEFDLVYASAEAVGTWQEMGLWIGANSTAGTGTLLAHVLSTWTKTSNQTATITWRVLVSS